LENSFEKGEEEGFYYFLIKIGKKITSNFFKQQNKNYLRKNFNFKKKIKPLKELKIPLVFRKNKLYIFYWINFFLYSSPTIKKYF